MKKILLLLSLAISVSITGNAQTNLSAGDIAFIAIQSGETGQTLPDRFAFVLLKAITAETEITFSDNSVLDPAQSAKYCKNEGFCNWITTTNLPAGTVISISADSTVNIGIATGSINLSQSGDQIIAFQAQGADSIALAAISTTGFEANCTSTCGGANNNKTCLPTGLTNGLNALSFTSEQNNAQFNLDDLSGSPAEILAQINNPANWVRSDQLQTWQPGTWSFQVTRLSGVVFEKELVLFPNPSQNSVQMLEFPGKPQSMEAIDRIGKSHALQIGPGGNIGVGHLSSGIYWLRIQSQDGKLFSSRLMKK
jgi:hypothetical protein